MRIYQRLSNLVPLAFGFGLVVAGGYTAFYIATAFDALPHRALVSLLSVVVVGTGLLIIAKSFSRVEASSAGTDEPHIPGLDVEVPVPKRPVK